jgi:hypothetical protein
MKTLVRRFPRETKAFLKKKEEKLRELLEKQKDRERVTTDGNYEDEPEYLEATNFAEIKTKMLLEQDGYVVVKGGWPDFLAYKDGRLRFIEVKSLSKNGNKKKGLEQNQQLIALLLEKYLGITVEVVCPWKNQEEFKEDEEKRQRAQWEWKKYLEWAR